MRTAERLLGCALVAAAALAAAVDDRWRTVEPPLELRLPRDHGAHPAFRSEWWYLSGIVEGEGGRRLGYQVTFFREGVDPAPPTTGASSLRARQVLAADLAVADVSSGAFHQAHRLRRADGLLAGFATDDLRVFIDDWELRREAGDAVVVAARDRDGGLGLELRLAPEKLLVAHGEGGVSVKGPEPGNASAYLSWTRLATRGTLSLGDERFAVTGESWLDHEWGTFRLGPDLVGWDWLGLRLADGRDLMLYRLRRPDGSSAPASAGTLVAADGSTTHLAAGDFTFEPLATRSSRSSGASYPARVRVRVPRTGCDVEVVSLVPDTEVDGRGTTGTVYWEGPVRLEGSCGGVGYMELTGYAGSPPAL